MLNHDTAELSMLKIYSWYLIVVESKRCTKIVLKIFSIWVSSPTASVYRAWWDSLIIILYRWMTVRFRWHFPSFYQAVILWKGARYWSLNGIQFVLNSWYTDVPIRGTSLYQFVVHWCTNSWYISVTIRATSVYHWWYIGVPIHGTTVYQSMVHLCANPWHISVLIGVPMRGTSVYKFVVHLCTNAWYTFVPVRGTSLYKSMIHLCTNPWYISVPLMVHLCTNSWYIGVQMYQLQVVHLCTNSWYIGVAIPGT